MENHSRNNDGTYGPAIDSKKVKYYYKPQAYHNKAAKGKQSKSKFVIKEGQQFSLFSMAVLDLDSPQWTCEENSCLFAIVNNGSTILGDAQERLAKFPNPVNDTDPWHGYPVKTKYSQNCPSDKLINLWIEHGVIDATTRRRIEKNKL